MQNAYGYKLPDYFMEYGPVIAGSETEAKALIRERLNTKRLPPGIRIWDLASRPLTQWRVAQAG